MIVGGEMDRTLITGHMPKRFVVVDVAILKNCFRGGNGGGGWAWGLGLWAVREIKSIIIYNHTWNILAKKKKKEYR